MENVCDDTEKFRSEIKCEVPFENLNQKISRITKQEGLALEKENNSDMVIPLLNSYFDGCSYLIPKIIGKIGKEIKYKILKIAANKDLNIRVRKYAIEGLGRMRDGSILAELNELLEDENIYIRKSVILANGFIKDRHSVDILLNLLEIEEEWVKKDIIWALGIIGENKAVDILLDMLNIKNLKFEIKKNIVIALGEIGDKKAVDTLIQILSDEHSGLQDYASFSLGKIGDKRALNPLIKKYLNPVWFLKDHYEKLLNKFSPHWRYLLKDYDHKIYRKKELSSKIFDNIKDAYDWHYGYLNKTHYILNGFNKIVGCLNLIFLSIYQGTYLFYWDTIEIKKGYRRRRLGTHLTNFMIKNELEKHKDFIVFLLVAKCEQYKLKFFSTLGFVPVKLRKTEVGTHCIMCYPFNENSEKLCQRLFDYFIWREEKKEFIPSDCKFAFNPNPTGLYWCNKKMIYVTGLEKQSCRYYVKEKEIFNEKKFLDLKCVIKQNP